MSVNGTAVGVKEKGSLEGGNDAKPGPVFGVLRAMLAAGETNVSGVCVNQRLVDKDLAPTVCYCRTLLVILDRNDSHSIEQGQHGGTKEPARRHVFP